MYVIYTIMYIAFNYEIETNDHDFYETHVDVEKFNSIRIDTNASNIRHYRHDASC